MDRIMGKEGEAIRNKNRERIWKQHEYNKYEI